MSRANARRVAIGVALILLVTLPGWIGGSTRSDPIVSDSYAQVR